MGAKFTRSLPKAGEDLNKRTTGGSVGNLLDIGESFDSVSVAAYQALMQRNVLDLGQVIGSAGKGSKVGLGSIGGILA